MSIPSISHPNNELTPLLPKNVVVNIKPAHDSQAETGIFTKGYIANGAVVLTNTLFQALFNRLNNNNTLDSDSNDHWFTLGVDMAAANFNNKMMKSNWSAVDSSTKQTLVLLGAIASAVAFDALAYLIPVEDSSQTSPIGKASIIATVNALGYLSAMAIAAIFQKQLFTKGPPPVKGEKQSAMKRIAESCALVLGTSALASFVNRTLINGSSSIGVVLNLAVSEMVNKLYKTGHKGAEGTAKKIELLASYWGISVLSDVAVGAMVPSSLTGFERYLGTTSVGATFSLLKVSSRVLLDKKEEEKKGYSPVAAVVAVATPLLATVGNHIASAGSAFSFGVKYLQKNLNSLSVRELYKAATNTAQRAGAALMPVALALTAELIAHHVDPHEKGDFTVTNIAVGSAASYAGLIVSDLLLGGDGDIDD